MASLNIKVLLPIPILHTGIQLGLQKDVVQGQVTIQRGAGSRTHKPHARSVTEILAYFWLTPVDQRLPAILGPSVHRSSPKCKETFSLITA